jgi:ArsR family transcriptional regulator
MKTNISNKAMQIHSKKISQLFQTLAQPSRLSILQTIGEGEACVCHLEAVLGYRQAYISQQLMALREAGLVSPRRDGRNIFYQLADPELLVLVRQAGQLLGFSPEELTFYRAGEKISHCTCPHCGSTGSDISLDQENQPLTTSTPNPMPSV